MMYKRKPVVAGSFYPADEKKLNRVIDEYLHNAGPSVIQSAYGVIVPHAGYVYSGPVAAYSYALLKNIEPEVVIVLAPSHSARFDGASIIPSGIYETPLGNVIIEEKIGKDLETKNNFSFIPQVHEAEHSLEVQVPFLQSILNEFTLVPIIVGTHDLAMLNDIAAAIKETIKYDKRKISVVISTDLSHYHSYDEAHEIDRVLIDAVESFDPQRVSDVCSSGTAEACGQGPLLLGMMLAKMLGAKGVETLNYSTSGDTGGDKSQVVGYLSAAFI
jgi:AmmeMemoRadiSam system protein B